MAKIIRLTKNTPRRKRWEHFKLRCRVLLFRLSYLTNLCTLLYLLEQDHILTNTYKKVLPIVENFLQELYMKVVPILESLIQQLPL